MNELFDEKMKVVLNLIRTNLSPEEAMKVTQAVENLTRAKRTLHEIDVWTADQGAKTTKTKVAAA